MDIAAFKASYPELSAPDDLISEWGIVAETLLPKPRWTTCWKKGVQLYVAHQLSVSGPILKAETIGDANFWKMSDYGKQFWNYVQIFGLGPDFKLKKGRG